MPASGARDELLARLHSSLQLRSELLQQRLLGAVPIELRVQRHPSVSQCRIR